jgi:hypothetical protein
LVLCLYLAFSSGVYALRAGQCGDECRDGMLHLRLLGNSHE